MTLFSCSSCSDSIPLHKPRIHCMVCSWHDICASCYVLSKHTGSHTPQHGTMLLEKSGTLPKPPPLPARPTSVVPSYRAQSPRPVRPNTGTPTNLLAQSPPPVPPATVTRIYSPVQPSTPSGTPQVQRKPVEIAPQAVPASRSVDAAEPRCNAGNATAGGQQGWKPLFEGSSPSRTALAFFNAVFDCLDTLKVGVLAPEQYSTFCDVQGYLPDEDVCKYEHVKTPGQGFLIYAIHTLVDLLADKLNYREEIQQANLRVYLRRSSRLRTPNCVRKLLHRARPTGSYCSPK